MPQLPQAHRPLTEIQFSTLAFMRATHSRTEKWPTIQQIAAHFGVSKCVIRERLAAMASKGVVRQPGPRRHYEATDTTPPRESFVLTGLQREVMAFMRAFHREHGIWPGPKTIARRLNASIAVVQELLMGMVRRGAIRRPSPMVPFEPTERSAVTCR